MGCLMGDVYTPGVVCAALSLVFCQHGFDGPIGEDVPRVEPGMPRAKRDPGHVGNLSCVVVDVEAGLRALLPVWRQMLVLKYVCGWTRVELAARFQCDVSVVDRVLLKAPQLMCDVLNGDA
uniref:Anti-sigma F factor n=1 Tax=Phage sp. ctesc4 TaxID=2828008 RepID=A0A8S5TCR0_9VIRU|nr:MAG TPA: anti-sigma F factor [Phage sp. ctesc4]